MKRKEMIEKYKETLAGISKANPFPDNGNHPDLGVAIDMLIYEYQVRAGERERTDTYGGIPEDFDWVGFGIDYQTMISKEVE